MTEKDALFARNQGKFIIYTLEIYDPTCCNQDSLEKYLGRNSHPYTNILYIYARGLLMYGGTLFFP